MNNSDIKILLRNCISCPHYPSNNAPSLTIGSGKKYYIFFILLFSFLLGFGLAKPAIATTASIPPTINLNDPAFFPLGVWLQSPINAARFKSLGINLFVGLWNGPTDQQLRDLEKAGMAVICDQNDTALHDPHNDIILGWIQQDEPDNSQRRKIGSIYNSPTAPSIVRERYTVIQTRDPSRPIVLNLGQGVAWDQWEGRGTRTNHPEDYTEYIKGGDIISFDIYPVTHKNPEVRGRLEFVARGVQRLKTLISPRQSVWSVIGVSRINDPTLRPSPSQVRSQVWMSIIHGSRGIIYFVHQFKPRFIEAAIFEDPEMTREMTQLNNLIQNMAVVLNSPDTNDIKKLTTSSPETSVAAVTKRHNSSLYLLSVAMRNNVTICSVEFAQVITDQEAEVIGESRKIKVRNGIMVDHFAPYEAHIYKIDMRTPPASE